MELQLFGINHRTSNVSERERFIINESNQHLLNSLIKEKFEGQITSIFGLSTCNRSELYLFGDMDIVNSFFEESSKLLDIDNISKNQFYFLQGEDACAYV